MAVVAAVAVVHGASAQMATVAAAAAQPMMLSESGPALFSTNEAAAWQVAAPKSAAVYYSQSPAAKQPKVKKPKPDPGVRPLQPRFEVFGGYSRWNPYSTVSGQKLTALPDGGLVSGTFYVDRNVGWELEGSYYEETSNDGRRGGAFGPVYRFLLPGMVARVHGLAGSDYLKGPVVTQISGGGFYANPPVWATVLTAGGSVDVSVPHTRGRFALRAQVDYQYLHASYGPAGASSGGQVNINSYRINPGVVFRFGHTADRPKGSQKANHY